MTTRAQLIATLKSALQQAEALPLDQPPDFTDTPPFRWLARLEEVWRSYGDTWASSRAIAGLLDLPMGPTEITQALTPIQGQRWTTRTGELVALEGRTCQHRREWRVVRARPLGQIAGPTIPPDLLTRPWALGVISGPQGSGKSTVVRALASGTPSLIMAIDGPRVRELVERLHGRGIGAPMVIESTDPRRAEALGADWELVMPAGELRWLRES